MEFVWMIPLYLIIPITGISLLYTGFGAGRGRGRKRIAVGFFFLSLPIMHSILVSFQKTKKEKSLIGLYTLDGTKKVILQLNADKTFELQSLDSVKDSGKGKWEFRRSEDDQVNLYFADSTELFFEVTYQGNAKYLGTTFWTGANHKYIKLVKASSRE